MAVASTHSAPAEPTWIVVGRDEGEITAIEVDGRGVEHARHVITEGFADWVAARELADPPRWVWSDTGAWYPELLAAGVRVGRCVDLRLCHAIIRDSARVQGAGALRAAVAWNAPGAAPQEALPALFDFVQERDVVPDGAAESVAEFLRQREAVAGSEDAARLGLLLAAESAGALIAAELRAAGIPWDPAVHDAILTDLLGPRPAGHSQPAKLAEAGERVRRALDDPAAPLDSPPKLLRVLHRNGIMAATTSRWELAEYDHPAIAPLLEYKKLARLLAANGWAWLDEWVRDRRFRPTYVPAGVVTGRWASAGGGALQLPRALRSAVRADPGWVLVVADVAQLEPRVLAAMSGDLALAAAARGRDLYAGIADAGAVSTRAEAKLALLGAMYGATTGDSGRLVPRLRRTYPKAMRLVDDAAKVGEAGGVVTTWLGRSSPPPPEDWQSMRAAALDPDASAADQARARRWAGDRGRFTRNFVVQGTAAEWALAWLADLRLRLRALPTLSTGGKRDGAQGLFSSQAHLAFFLHDEIIVHTPAEQAESVARVVTESAAAAGRLLFGGFPIDFPLDVRIGTSAAKD